MFNEPGGTGSSLAAAKHLPGFPGRALQEAISQRLSKCQSDSYSAALKDSGPFLCDISAATVPLKH